MKIALYRDGEEKPFQIMKGDELGEAYAAYQQKVWGYEEPNTSTERERKSLLTFLSTLEEEPPFAMCVDEESCRIRGPECTGACQVYGAKEEPKPERDVVEEIASWLESEPTQFPNLEGWKKTMEAFKRAADAIRIKWRDKPESV
jgi:hypothetical protein